MIPAARAAAAIAVLDRILDGTPAAQALTNWARQARYAGSGDRRAVRDLVFRALRQRRSAAAMGGSETGRGLILGLAREEGQQAIWFDGSPYGPAPEGPGDESRPLTENEKLDLPDWLIPRLRMALEADFPAIARLMRHQAPIVLRVNAVRISRQDAADLLAKDGIETRPHPLTAYGLEVMTNARKVRSSAAYASGLIELQDAASQAVVESLPLQPGLHVLDLCAGGGGKILAMAAREELHLWAHDAAPKRMKDLPVRAARARAQITIIHDPQQAAPYDLVLADVPCSGSGSWRRDPEGKWRLTPKSLAELQKLQSDIMDRAATLLCAGGKLAYVTCSFLREENEDQIAGFLARHPGWHCEIQRRFDPLQGGDGFFLAVLAGPAAAPMK